jgi:hypothetical protein
MPQELGRCLGVYEINLDKKTKFFEDFLSMSFDESRRKDLDNPKIDSQSRVFIKGSIITKSTKNKSENKFVEYKFKTAHLKIVKIDEVEYFRDIYFITNKKRGIYYEFVGKFEDKMVTEKTSGNYTMIRGKLSIYKDGKLLAEETLPFFEYADL